MKLKSYWEISKMMRKVYNHKFGNYFDTAGKRIIVIMLVFFFLVASIITGNILSSDIVDLFLNGNLNILYSANITYLVGESTLSFVIFILLKYTASETSSVLKVIKQLPISSRVKYLSYYSIQFLLSIWTPVFVYISILIPKMLLAHVDIKIVLLIMEIFILQAIFITAISNFVYNLFFFIGYKLKIPFARGISLFLQLFLFILLLYFQMKDIQTLLLDYGKMHYDILSWFSGLLGKLLNGQQYHISNLLLVGFPVIIVVLCIYSFQLLSQIDSEVQSSKVLSKLKQPRNYSMNFLIKDIKLLIRNENVLFLLIIVVIIAIGTTIFSTFLGFQSTILQILTALISSIAIFSYGLDYQNIVIYKFLGQSKKSFLLSKFFSGITISMIFTIAILLLMLPRLNITILSLLNIGKIIFITSLSSFILGVCIPFSKESSFSQITLSITVFLGIFPATYILRKISNLSIIEQIIIYLCIVSFFFTTTFHIFNKNWEGKKD